jgi:hypothetical protein
VPLAVPAAPPAIDLDTAELDKIIGVKGNNGGVYALGGRGATRSRRTGCR